MTIGTDDDDDDDDDIGTERMEKYQNTHFFFFCVAHYCWNFSPEFCTFFFTFYDNL